MGQSVGCPVLSRDSWYFGNEQWEEESSVCVWCAVCAVCA